MDANTDPLRVKIVEEADFYANSHPYQVKITGEGGLGVSKGYFYNGAFYKDAEHTELITPKEGQIFYDLTGKTVYIYDGESYRNIGESGDSDVVDIVNTYADLQNYPTASLKDKDIIKVLADETHDGKIAYYRWQKSTTIWEFIGAQGPYYTKAEIDTALNDKQDNLTAGENISIVNNVISASGGIKVLTTADYNYPTNNPDGVAFWLLPAGAYRVLVGLNFYTDRMNCSSINFAGDFYISQGNFFSQYIATTHMTTGAYEYVRVDSSNGALKFRGYIVPTVNNLTSNSDVAPLSAYQGKILKNLIDNRVPAPTTADVDKFLKGDGTWSEAGGGVKVLTSADYNYPEDNPNRVAVRLLEPGVYVVGEKDLQVDYGFSSTRVSHFVVSKNQTYSSSENYIYCYLWFITDQGIATGKYRGVAVTLTTTSDNIPLTQRYIDIEPIDNLTNYNINFPLSANQGRILKNLIDTRVPAPTASDTDKFLKGDGTWSEAGAAITWRTW